MVVESFANNIIIDLSYDLNKYTQHKLVWKLLNVGYLHLHTVIDLYRLHRNEKLLEIFAYPSNNRAFYRPELNL